jgi:Mg-chelatase subunit ChlI
LDSYVDEVNLLDDGLVDVVLDSGVWVATWLGS